MIFIITSHRLTLALSPSDLMSYILFRHLSSMRNLLLPHRSLRILSLRNTFGVGTFLLLLKIFLSLQLIVCFYRIHTHIHIYIYIYTHTQIYTHAHTHIHTHTHTHTHTPTWMREGGRMRGSTLVSQFLIFHKNVCPITRK